MCKRPDSPGLTWNAKELAVTQNLISIALSDEDASAVNAKIVELESRLSGLIALDNDTRRQITKMGGKSEAFVRQTLTVLEQNPDIVPPALGMIEAEADLVALDRLRPLLRRLQRLVSAGSAFCPHFAPCRAC